MNSKQKARSALGKEEKHMRYAPFEEERLIELGDAPEISIVPSAPEL